MNRKKLTEIRRELKEIYKSPHNRKYRDLVSIAEQLGRKEKNRGKEPTFERDDNPILCPPLTIPKHSGDMRPKTVRSVAGQLLNDVDVWDIFLMETENDQ